MFIRNDYLRWFFLFNFAFGLIAFSIHYLGYSYNTFINIANAGFIGTIAGLCYYYGRTAIGHVKGGNFTGEGLLIVGIVAAYLAMAGQRLLNIGIRSTEQLEWLRNSWVIAWFLLVATGGVVMHIFAPTVNQDDLTKQNIKSVYVAIAVAAFTAGCILTAILSGLVSGDI